MIECLTTLMYQGVRFCAIFCAWLGCSCPTFRISELVFGAASKGALDIAFDCVASYRRAHRTCLGILAVTRLTGERLDEREHTAVAQVAVVGDGEHWRGLVFIGAIHSTVAGLSLPRGYTVNGSTRAACRVCENEVRARCFRRCSRSIIALNAGPPDRLPLPRP